MLAVFNFFCPVFQPDCGFFVIEVQYLWQFMVSIGSCINYSIKIDMAHGFLLKHLVWTHTIFWLMDYSVMMA